MKKLSKPQPARESALLSPEPENRLSAAAASAPPASPPKKLGEAELEIMQAIWSGEVPTTSVEVRERIKSRRDWPLSTIMTSLSRLEDKGFLRCERQSGTNLYFPTVSENDYKAGASKSFLKRLYNNSARSLVATLYDNDMLGKDDIRELREYLDRLEEEKNG